MIGETRQCSVSLLIRGPRDGDDSELHNLISQLSVEPDLSWFRGDHGTVEGLLRKSSLWAIQADRTRVGNAEDAVVSLLGRLKAREGTVELIASRDRTAVDVCVGVALEGDSDICGLYLSPATVSDLAELGASLDVEARCTTCAPVSTENSSGS